MNTDANEKVDLIVLEVGHTHKDGSMEKELGLLTIVHPLNLPGELRALHKASVLLQANTITEVERMRLFVTPVSLGIHEWSRIRPTLGIPGYHSLTEEKAQSFLIQETVYLHIVNNYVDWGRELDTLDIETTTEIVSVHYKQREVERCTDLEKKLMFLNTLQGGRTLLHLGALL